MTGRRFLTLDALRAIGALMVVLHHVGFHTGRYDRGWTGAMLSHFDLGVAIFFVVSGFLLARPSFEASASASPWPRTGRYLWKRALRILPLYWVVVVVCLLGEPANSEVGLRGWISNLTLTQIYTQQHHDQGLAHMWSLCTEVAFYLALPALMPLLTPRRGLHLRRVVGISALLSVGGLVWAAGSERWIGHPFASEWLPAYLPWFLAGTVLAACSVHERARTRLDAVARDLVGWWLLALGLFVAASTALTGPVSLTEAPTPGQVVLKSVLYVAIAVCLVLPLVFGPELEGPVRRWLASAVPRRLGEISYGIFAIHMFVLLMGMQVLGLGVFNDHFWTVLTMTLAVTIPLAALSYAHLERRVMRLRGWRPSLRTASRQPEPETEPEPEPEPGRGVTEAVAATSTTATTENA